MHEASKDERRVSQNALFRQYARNLTELCNANERMENIKGDLRQADLCLGVSSPAILTPEQAAYKNRTKAFVGDRNIALIMWRERTLALLAAEEKAASRLNAECMETMRMIANAGLDDLENKLLSGRYFGYESVRSLSTIHGISKSTAYRIIVTALDKIYGDLGQKP